MKSSERANDVFVATDDEDDDDEGEATNGEASIEKDDVAFVAGDFDEVDEEEEEDANPKPVRRSLSGDEDASRL